MIISTTITSPCQNCTDRCIGCHTTCGDYAIYKQELERRRTELKTENEKEAFVRVENPIPSAIYRMPPYTQSIQPYEYGEPYSKKTCLWLKGLPNLEPTKILTEYKPYVSCGTSKNKGNKDKSGVSRSGGAAKVRSKTFQGIAQAMAQQWSAYLTGQTDKQLSFFEE